MQDKQFIAESRRGLFSKDQHRLLMSLAYDCSWHVLPSFGQSIDERMLHAMDLAIAWKEGKARVDKAGEASVMELILTDRRIKNISYNNYQEII